MDSAKHHFPVSADKQGGGQKDEAAGSTKTSKESKFSHSD